MTIQSTFFPIRKKINPKGSMYELTCDIIIKKLIQYKHKENLNNDKLFTIKLKKGEELWFTLASWDW